MNKTKRLITAAARRRAKDARALARLNIQAFDGPPPFAGPVAGFAEATARAAARRSGLKPYIVRADRTTEYRVMARNPEDAIDRMTMSGEGEEIDGITHKITAEPEGA
jgi:hypothetical protein